MEKQMKPLSSTATLLGGFSFFAFGDWGFNQNEAKLCAAVMNNIFLKQQQQHHNNKLVPRLVLALGDNFYPSGIFGVNDPQVQETWLNVFIEPYKSTLGAIPWKIVLGNHCYMSARAQPQLDLSFAANNPLLLLSASRSRKTTTTTTTTTEEPPQRLEQQQEEDVDGNWFVKCNRLSLDTLQQIAREEEKTGNNNHGDDEQQQQLGHPRRHPQELNSQKINQYHPLLRNAARIWQAYGDDDQTRASSCYKFSVPLLPSEFYQQKKNSDAAASSASIAPTTKNSTRPTLDPKIHAVDFFAFDTNAAQFSVRRDEPAVLERYPEQLAWLVKSLSESKAMFKVFFAHHPMYTKGQNHGTVGDCLRLPEYLDRRGCGPHKGMGLEKVLIDGGVDFYFAGHEHVMQSVLGPGGIQHIGAGSVLETGFYGGQALERHMDFVAQTIGFAHATVSVSSRKKKSENGDEDDDDDALAECCFHANFKVDFVAAKSGEVLHSVGKTKPLFS